MTPDPMPKAPAASLSPAHLPHDPRAHHDLTTSPNGPISNTASFQPTPRRKPVPQPALDPQKYTYNPSYPSHRPRSRPRPWRTLPRRTLLLLALGAALLLILIIGLAAGLTHRSHSQNLPLPSAHGGPYTGDLTYYAPGLGACGLTSANGDAIVAVSHLLFDAVSTGSNPNANPLCGKTVRVKSPSGAVSVDLKVVDRCVGCKARDLDVTEDTFAKLADVALGRVKVEWSWLEDVPGQAGGGG